MKKMKKFEVLVGIDKVVWEINEDRLDMFLYMLDSIYMPYEYKEITEQIDRRGKWYITFKTSDTIYLDSECEMWKSLYLNNEEKRPVSCYGEIF